MSLLKRKAKLFEMQVHDMTLRVTAPEDYYEEARASALQFWEQVNAYAVRNPRFRTSKRPVPVGDDAPAVVREMADIATRVGVGPLFTFQGAVTDHVGRFLARQLSEVTVSSEGDYFIATKRRQKITVARGLYGENLAVAVDPVHSPLGVYTSLGRPKLAAETVDGLAVVAVSCAAADAHAAAVLATLGKPNSFGAALAYLQSQEDVLGGVVIRGDRVGVAGALEIAA